MARDAAATLSSFMVDGMPDPARFEAVVGELLDAAGAGREVRVFGEMVALLVAEGKPDAALSLEALWNDLQERHTFALLCAYPMQGFSREEHGRLFQHICNEHSQVRPAESFVEILSGLRPCARRRRLTSITIWLASAALLAETWFARSTRAPAGAASAAVRASTSASWPCRRVRCPPPIGPSMMRP